MKSKNVILSDYSLDGNPLHEHPKRLTKRMRKQFFGKGPAGESGIGRKRRRQEDSAANLKAQAKKRRPHHDI